MDVNAPVALVGARCSTLDRAVGDVTVWGSRGDGDFHYISVAILTTDRNGPAPVRAKQQPHLEWVGRCSARPSAWWLRSPASSCWPASG
jgi:hypothetical protein